MKNYKILSLLLSLLFLCFSPLFAQMEWICATASAGWTRRDGHTSVMFDNKIWVLGGSDDGGYRNNVWFSTNGVNWTQVTASAPWAGGFSYTSVEFDNKMWLIGEYAESFRNEVWYSEDGINWIQATDSTEWSARCYFTLVVFDNKMWVLGGFVNAKGLVNDVWYSADGVNWTLVTDSAGWSSRMLHTSVVFDNKIWVLGGYGMLDTIKNDVWYSTGLGIGEERTTLDAECLIPEIYPNPAKSVMRVRVPLSVKTIKIFDVSGKTIREIASPLKADRNDSEIKISLKGINPGIYFLCLGSTVQKFLVVR